jgi:hypothetical protein
MNGKMVIVFEMEKIEKRNNIKLMVFVSAAIALLAFMGLGYSWWNAAPPEKTCASCHEIESSVHSFAGSSHRELSCAECHGTALSNGIHSLKEKGRMLVSHFSNVYVEEISMNEKQLLDVMDNCKRCHASEYAKWFSGGHSMQYQHVLLNEKQNRAEQINFDCLRCHGMFYDENIDQLVEPLNTAGPWNMKDEKAAYRAAIPCMACHQIHSPGIVSQSPEYSDPRAIFYEHERPVANVAFYDRNEGMHFTANQLPKPKIWHNGEPVRVSTDATMRTCVQCHAPNAFHHSGSSDDRIPRGVHEGLSCSSCHEPHSNESRNSCSSCHPAISNCGLDVEKMNTSFAFRESEHNIHFVSCTDCHTN